MHANTSVVQLTNNCMPRAAVQATMAPCCWLGSPPAALEWLLFRSALPQIAHVLLNLGKCVVRCLDQRQVVYRLQNRGHRCFCVHTFLSQQVPRRKHNSAPAPRHAPHQSDDNSIEAIRTSWNLISSYLYLLHVHENSTRAGAQ
jgi:hypothetical protein